MSDKIELKCTREQFNDLSKACFDARDGSVKIHVEKAALMALIFDHQKLVEKFKPDLTGHV